MSERFRSQRKQSDGRFTAARLMKSQSNGNYEFYACLAFHVAIMWMVAGHKALTLCGHYPSYYDLLKALFKLTHQIPAVWKIHFEI